MDRGGERERERKTEGGRVREGNAVEDEESTQKRRWGGEEADRNRRE